VPELPEVPPPGSETSSAAKRRRDPRNLVIVVLAAGVLALGATLLADRYPGLLARLAPAPPGEAVSVVDVVLDRSTLRSIDFIFDRPLGLDKVGDAIGRDPATISPKVGGVWRWQTVNVLRFEPSSSLELATAYTIELIPDRLLKTGQTFKGPVTRTLKTDQFQVERVDVFEEPATGETAGVVLRGEMRFNYPVDPRVLATKARLVDPLLGDDSPVPLNVEISYQSRVIGFNAGPVAKRKEERELRLVILQDLTSTQGNVPLTADFVKTIPIGSNETLAVRGITATPGVPEGTLRIILSSPVDPSVAEKYVKVSPDVKARLTAARNEVLLTGPFAPGQEYEVSIGQGMPGTDESVLKEAFTQKVRMMDLPPSYDFQSAGMFLSASGSRSVAVESVNVDQVSLVIDRVYLNNLFYFFQFNSYDAFDEGYYAYGGFNHALGNRLEEKGLRLGGTRNQKVVTTLDLDKLVPRREPGLYRIGLNVPGEYDGKDRWLLITDLGVVAKQGDGEFLVWVSSFADLSPVPNAAVKVLSDQNQLLATGKTDASGLWHGKDLGGWSENRRPFMVTVERGDDFSFVFMGRSGIDTSGFDVGGAERPTGGYEAFLYGERDIYRPGEKVEGVAIVRDGNLLPPPSMPLFLRYRDSEGNDRGSVRLAMDRKGLAPFTHAIASYAATGRHSLEVVAGETVIGSYRFQVEEFIPDRIKVGIAPEKASIVAGEKLAFDVTGAYLFGPPAAGLPLETRVRLSPSPFAPKGYETFTFANPERRFDAHEIHAVTGEALDPNGRKSFSIDVPAGLPPPSSLEAIITARVQEQGGRGVSAAQRVIVHPWRSYLGLRREGKAMPDPGRKVSFTWVAVAPDGSEAKAGPLRADFFEDRWQTSLRRTSAGNYRYESVRDPILVDSLTVEAGAPRGEVSFTPRKYGSYRAMITDTASGASAEVEFYASGWGYSPWAIKDPGRIEIDLDKDEYRAGETATAQIRAPFSGRLLLTVERDGIYQTEVHDLTGNTAKISIPVKAEWRPNAYVTATVIRAAGDLEPGAAGRAFGAVPLNVNRAPNHLGVTVTAPREVRPKTKLTVQVAAAPNASVTVAAVDEGILQLIAQKTPDPFDFFYRKLALGVKGYDIFALLMPEVKRGERKPAAGGDEGMRGRAQFVGTSGIRRVEPVAFWSGVVETDASGRASVSFDLPEFQGALRVMATGIDRDRFGSGEAMARVRSPLVLLPTFPRILSLKETAKIPITVRNDTGHDGSIEILLTASGAAAVEGSGRQTAAVPNNAERTVYFDVKTGDTMGEARFEATASGNGETAAATTSLPVRPDLPFVTIDRSGAVTAADTTIPANDDVSSLRPATVTREVRVSALPLLQFYGKLRDLLRYPYGCVEQTTSTAFPLLYMGDLAKEWDPETFAKSDPSIYVQAGIDRLSSLQIYSGAFSMWPGGTIPHPWGTVYATHFLVEAKLAGYGVPSYVHDHALDYLANRVKAKAAYAPDELEEVAYALYVLARAGRADTGTMDFIRERQSKDLTAVERALLGAAYAAAGNPRALSEMLADIRDVEEVKRQTGGSFGSTRRNRALLLLAFLDAAPDDPRVPEIAGRLSRDASTSGWWTTQETAFTFLALGRFAGRQARRPAWSGTLYAGDTKIGSFTSKTAVFRDVPGSGAIRIKMDGAYESGSAYYSVSTRGAPTDEAFKPAQSGIEIEREYLNRTGSPLDLASVTQGDLIVARTRVRSLSGRIENVVVQNLLPSGLEVENPRLKSSETLPFVSDAGDGGPEFLDYRDDRVLTVVTLDSEWITSYALLRAVTPGSFRLPPIQAEAMYDPTLRATGARGTIEVKTRP